MRKKIMIITIVIVVLVFATAGIIYYLSLQPFYKPGVVAAGKNLRGPLTPPAQPAGSEIWLVEGDIELAHFSAGNGPTNVLIIHGGPGQPYRHPWHGLEALEDEYTFHYYDQRGCGGSTRPIDRFESRNMYQNMKDLEQSLGMGAQLADIERIRQILGEEKLILIGHSWGGFLASLYAVEFPEHVEKLILVSPANMLVMPQPESDSDLFASVRTRLPEDQLAEYDAFMKEYFDFNSLFQKSEADLVSMNEQFGAYYLSIMGASETDIIDQGRPGGWMVWAPYISIGRRYDYRPALEGINVPVLVIHGAGDMQSEAASRLYAEAFSNAEFVVIRNAGHFSPDEQPGQFATVVGAFLAGR
ncbi:MAG: alpha/beta hydrolase [Anaerolineales bacterium]|nr:alpha/beta hydrolase [Anaerolineales bacterium]